MLIHLAFLSFRAYISTILLTCVVLLYCCVLSVNGDDDDDDVCIWKCVARWNGDGRQTTKWTRCGTCLQCY